MLGSLRASILCGAVLIAGADHARADGSDSPDGPPSERVAHPEPRVIVNVLSVRGPHVQAKVQHAARFGWKRIVRCYKASGAKRPAIVRLGLELSSEGQVSDAWSGSAQPEHRALSTCLASGLQGLAMPKASASSTADLEIRLAPGDAPPKRAAR